MPTYDIQELLVEQSAGYLQLGSARMALLDIEAGFWSIRRQMEALIGENLTNAVLQQAGANGGASFAKTFQGQSGLKKSAAFTVCLNAYQLAGFGQFEIISMEWPLGRLQIRASHAFEAWMYQQQNEKTDIPICAYSAGVFVGFVNIIGERQDVVCIEHACQAKGDEACLFELLPASQAKGQTVVPYIPDPGLGRQINLLEMLFDRMPMGIAIIDREYCIQRYNPTWEDFAERYAPPTAAPLAPGICYFDHLPGTEPTVLPLYERVLTGETVRQNSVRLESGGIVTYWDVVLAPLLEDGEVSGILSVTVDATERVEAQQHLEQRVEERTHALRTLLQVSQDISSTLELETLLDLVLDQLKAVVDYTGASILVLRDGHLEVRAYRGPIPKNEVNLLRFPLERALVNREVIRQRQPLIINDVLGDEPLAGMFRQTAGDELDSTFGYVRSWLGVPLIFKDEMLGMLTLDHSKPDYFSNRHAELVLTFANQVGVAIENARLFEKAEVAAMVAERNRLARDLHDAVTQTLFSASMIAEVLPKIWERDPQEGLRRLEELRQLTRGALSEMRTLLLELRPAALTDTDLDDLIGHQVNAFNARTRLPVEFMHNCEQNPPSDVKEVFYRIAQEAFNNIAKHANASAVSVRLDCRPDRAELVIQDDGIGFDSASITSEGMGLGIMQERARNVGAQFEIQSQLHEGTRLRILWQESNHKEYKDE
jgi:two-component system nitrate/nitrite sensor histidine kinase NarX